MKEKRNKKEDRKKKEITKEKRKKDGWKERMKERTRRIDLENGGVAKKMRSKPKREFCMKRSLLTRWWQLPKEEVVVDVVVVVAAAAVTAVVEMLRRSRRYSQKLGNIFDCATGILYSVLNGCFLR